MQTYFWVWLAISHLPPFDLGQSWPTVTRRPGGVGLRTSPRIKKRRAQTRFRIFVIRSTPASYTLPIAFYKYAPPFFLPVAPNPRNQELSTKGSSSPQLIAGQLSYSLTISIALIRPKLGGGHVFLPRPRPRPPSRAHRLPPHRPQEQIRRLRRWVYF